MKFDEILVRIGEFGSYQKRIYHLLCLPALLCGTQVMSIVFIMTIPPYRCHLPDYPNDTYKIQGENHARLINLTIPPGDEHSNELYSQCDVYSDVNTSLMHDGYTNGEEDFVTSSVNRSTSHCSKWVYDRSEYKSTVVTEFNIVCEDKILRSHGAMVQFAGALCGAIFMGIVADLVGRKKAIMLSLVLQFATSLGVFLTPSYHVMIGLRAVSGIATHSLFAISASTGIELVGPSKRSFAGNVVNMYWAVGMLILLPLAYFIRDWRYLQLSICILTVPMFALWWLIPESPRWLLDKQKYKEAEKVLEKICRSNKTKLPPQAIDAETADEGPQARFTAMFTHRVLILRTLIIFFNWLAVNLLYYGLSLNIENLAGSIYLNYLFGTIVEIIAYTLCLLLLNRTGRRRLHCALLLMGGVACIAVMLPITLGSEEHRWIATLLSMIGKLSASGCYAILYIMSSELFPTILRNSAIGFCSVFENVGGMTAPYIVDLGILIGGPFAQGLPMMVFGGVAILAGLGSLLLPETLNKILPETIQDAIDFDKQDRPLTKHLNQEYMMCPTDQENHLQQESSKL